MYTTVRGERVKRFAVSDRYASEYIQNLPLSRQNGYAVLKPDLLCEWIYSTYWWDSLQSTHLPPPSHGREWKVEGAMSQVPCVLTSADEPWEATILCCNILQNTAAHCNPKWQCSRSCELQYTAMHCNTLQHKVTMRSVGTDTFFQTTGLWPSDHRHSHLAFVPVVTALFSWFFCFRVKTYIYMFCAASTTKFWKRDTGSASETAFQGF